MYESRSHREFHSLSLVVTSGRALSVQNLERAQTKDRFLHGDLSLKDGGVVSLRGRSVCSHLGHGGYKRGHDPSSVSMPACSLACFARLFDFAAFTPSFAGLLV
jgi:hypothetical protein